LVAVDVEFDTNLSRLIGELQSVLLTLKIAAFDDLLLIVQEPYEALPQSSLPVDRALLLCALV
jgi:hypothetical protein